MLDSNVIDHVEKKIMEAPVVGNPAARIYNGMADFFGRVMQQRSVQDDWVPAILQDHPVDTVRIAEARERAAQYPPVPNTAHPITTWCASGRGLTAPGTRTSSGCMRRKSPMETTASARRTAMRWR